MDEGIGTLAVAASLLTALRNNATILKAQQELLKAHADHQRGRFLFEIKLELHRKLSAVAFSLKDSLDKAAAKNYYSNSAIFRLTGALRFPFR